MILPRSIIKRCFRCITISQRLPPCSLFSFYTDGIYSLEEQRKRLMQGEDIHMILSSELYFHSISVHNSILEFFCPGHHPRFEWLF